MRVAASRHAIDQSAERCDLSEEALVSHVWVAAHRGRTYHPSPRNSKYKNEFWIAVSGPKGNGTAVCVRDDSGSIRIVTVRDSRQFTQGERAGEVLAHRPFAVLKR